MKLKYAPTSIGGYFYTRNFCSLPPGKRIMWAARKQSVAWFRDDH
jgi:hypothetical protein